jgi:hypothetical protein
MSESVKSETPEPYDPETRHMTTLSVQLHPSTEEGSLSRLVLLAKMDDNMNRKLVTDYTDDLTPTFMANELVALGFISEVGVTLWQYQSALSSIL